MKSGKYHLVAVPMVSARRGAFGLSPRCEVGSLLFDIYSFASVSDQELWQPKGVFVRMSIEMARTRLRHSTLHHNEGQIG